MVQTRGQKAYGLLTLEHCRDMCYDQGQVELFRAMVERAGLPFDLNCIDLSDDIADACAMDPDVRVPRATADDVMAGLYTSLQSIVIEGRNLGDGSSPSTVVPPRRATKKPDKFSHSKYDKRRK